MTVINRAPSAVRAAATDSAVHYDVPPAVFEMLLDRNMNYSSGWYDGGEEDLDAAQVCKMERLAATIGLESGERVLDAGCGWGGPALWLAEHRGCRVHGINLSSSQCEYANAWAARRGLTERFRAEQCAILEFRDPQPFDHVLFLESIIHMPEKAEIFARCREVLQPGGTVFVQESCYDRASQRTRYQSERGHREVDQAFGGTGAMVSAGEMIAFMEEAGLQPERLEDMSTHYVRTLSQWLGRLDQHCDAMRAVSDAAYRMLRRYLMIALATYRTGHTRCYQFTARRPAA